MKIRSRRGNSIIEVAITMPLIMMILIGMTQIAGITYTYYELRKAVYATATYLATQQGVNFCNNPSDPTIASAINFGVTGTTDASQPAIVNGLTPDMIAVTPESYDPVANTLSSYDTSLCGMIPPDFITVSIVNGYTVRPAIPFFSTIQPFALSPEVKVPYGGT
jgi:hypothetical protein